MRSALKQFSERGYAAVSVQEIVEAAKVSKPALYYHFGDKAGLFQALVDQAHDERFRLMAEAAAKGTTIAGKLESIISALFQFSMRNQELVRLAFATAFASPGATPCRARCHGKVKRNADFIKKLMQEAKARGELDSQYTDDELAMAVFGLFNSHITVRLLTPGYPLNHKVAEKIVRLFMQGAETGSARASVANGRQPSSKADR